ncbi:solute carrier family 66 member 2 [Folsomia candida]|uniref:solute carrier family 66 member 2 n=1 Tax=Folsomia candida TaxID=158441 RepID=UPI00160529C5|nr:solute carrier family 66 member 2 [Folsomia candida]
MTSSDINGEFLATFLSQVFLIFGGVLPYIPQYLDIARGDASGFSTLVCLVLVLANTLRIVYWFGHSFDDALLVQSVIMLLTMFIMLDLCVRVERLRRRSLSLPITERVFTDFKLEDFWAWTNLASYIQVTILIATIASATIFIFLDNSIVVEGIGYAALLTESCLALPQFLKNQRNRSTQGMNVLMVLMWALGDAFKEFFYVWKNQPLPFILCASIQLLMDFLILIQVVIFQ